MYSMSDIGSNGHEVEEDQPLGPRAEHHQSSKTLNAKAQQRKRAELRRKKLAEDHCNAMVKCTTTNDILARNRVVAIKLKSKVESGNIADSTVASFLKLTSTQL